MVTPDHLAILEWPRMCILVTAGCADRGLFDNSFNYASVSLASVCLLALLVRGSIFAARIYDNVKQGNHW